MDILFYIAMAVIFGFIFGKCCQLVKLPSVVGYLIAGLIFGPSFLNIYTTTQLEEMSGFTGFALAIVAFMIGSEMKLHTLKELGSGIGIITLLESFGAFFTVAVGVFLITGHFYYAMIFGAIAPASAPAGTVAVLQESKSKGKLTNALYAVVGLDDGLAIMIFAVAIALAKLSFTGNAVSVEALITGPVWEIIGSILLGTVFGVMTGWCGRRLRGQEAIMAVSLGAILLCAALSEYFHFSLILANLAMGMTFVNLYPTVNAKSYKAVNYLTYPTFIIFFFLAGAHLQIRLLGAMGLIGLIYIICRSTGLIGGAFLGATLARSSAVIRKYLGLGILSQAGVAIGLAVLAAQEFRTLGDDGAHIAAIVMNTVAATTIVFEIIGPICTKFAITKAGEAGLNITEEDLIEIYTVENVMDKDIPVIKAGNSLNEVIQLVTDTTNFYYPVTDHNQKLIGAVTLDGIRKTFNTQELNDWLVALDIAEPVTETMPPNTELAQAIEKAKNANLDYIPVTNGNDQNNLVGIFDLQSVHRKLSAEILERQRQADLQHTQTVT